MKNLILIGIMFIVATVRSQNVNFKINNDYPSLGKGETKDERIAKEVQRLLKNLKKKVIKEEDLQIFYDSVAQAENIEDDPIYNAYKNAYEKEIDDLVKNQQDKLNEIDGDSSVEDVKKIEDEVAELEVKIKMLVQKKQALTDVANYKADRVHFFYFGRHNANAYYNIMYSDGGKKFNFLNNSGVNLGDRTGAVYAELVAGNMGVFRLSIGTTVANSSAEEKGKETQEEAFRRLATNGGNTVLKAEYPLLNIFSKDNQYNFLGRFLARGAADFPAFGTETNDFAGSLSAGLDFYADAATENQEIRLYGNFNLNYMLASQSYATNLGINHKRFSFGTVSVGVVVLNKLNLSVLLSSVSSEQNLRNHNVIIGGTLLL